MEDLDKVYAKRIAEEYAPKKERKVVKLKKLDDKVKKPALIFSYLFGIISLLLIGLGMSMVLTDFGIKGELGEIIGVLLGVVGVFLCSINYLLYSKILMYRKKKYAFEIKELAKDILEETN